MSRIAEKENSWMHFSDKCAIMLEVMTIKIKSRIDLLNDIGGTRLNMAKGWYL